MTYPQPVLAKIGFDEGISCDFPIPPARQAVDVQIGPFSLGAEARVAGRFDAEGGRRGQGARGGVGIGAEVAVSGAAAGVVGDAAALVLLTLLRLFAL